MLPRAFNCLFYSKNLPRFAGGPSQSHEARLDEFRTQNIHLNVEMDVLYYKER